MSAKAAVSPLLGGDGHGSGTRWRGCMPLSRSLSSSEPSEERGHDGVDRVVVSRCQQEKPQHRAHRKGPVSDQAVGVKNHSPRRPSDLGTKRAGARVRARWMLRLEGLVLREPCLHPGFAGLGIGGVC